QRQRLVMTQRECDVALEPIAEIPAIEQTRQGIAQRRLIEASLKIRVDIIVIRESKHARGSDLDLVALFEDMLFDASTVGVRAIGRTGVSEHVLAIALLDDGVGPRDPFIP